jgi:hypothetical protein
MNSLITHPKNYSKVNEIQMKTITQDKYGMSKQNQIRDKLLWTDEHKVPGKKFVYNSESELTFTQLLYGEYGATLSYNFHSQSVNENKITDCQQMCYETHRNMTFTPPT